MDQTFPNCQVKSEVAQWPYVRACKEIATHSIVPHMRLYGNGIEFICTEHAKAMVDGYGESSVQRLEYDAESGTIRTVVSGNSPEAELPFTTESDGTENE